ncbi:MAG: YraN family protein [Acutalibacteraceae bacterium]
MSGTKSIGNSGEDLAARYLESKGYDIIARNFHSRYGEIDIIAKNAEYIAYVEVKTRSINSYGLPREAVTLQKQQKIIKTAYVFEAQHPYDLQPRFDVIEIYTTGKNEFAPRKLTHIKGAFELNGDEDYALF